MATQNPDLTPIGRVHSSLAQRSGAPRQPWEGAPPARLEIFAPFLEALDGIQPGQDIWVLTWLHQSRRSTLKVYPRGAPPLTGVFATRSPDRPNPIGLHRTRVIRVDPGGWLEVAAIEAIDGTPILDLKPVLEGEAAPPRNTLVDHGSGHMALDRGDPGAPV